MSTKIRRLFFWLSGAGTESLEACPTWEQRKYVAFGATVLVPSVFAFIACSYALSTLTTDWRIIAGVSLVWSFIILTIDRALLASYRPYLSFVRKLGQFSLRFVIALLMGLTISHPLALMLFRDTISAEVEKDRQREVEAARAVTERQKQTVEQKITVLDTEIAALQAKHEETFSGSLVDKWNADMTAKPQANANGATDPQAALDAKIKDTKAPFDEKIAKLDEELKTQGAQFTTVKDELDFWQKEYEREINGQRSGYFGVGPRARSIEADQLAWRRVEVGRLSGMIEQLTARKKQLRAESANLESGLVTEFETTQTQEQERQRAEKERLAVLKKQIQEQQAEQFVEQQKVVRSKFTSQIDTKLEEIGRLRADIAAFAKDGQERVTKLQNEGRRDILTQTLALHRIFQLGEQGGQFALLAYGVLTLLFMLVDTIPLVVKFFTAPGPYDTLLDRDELRYRKEHEAFLESYVRYMDDLNAGQFTSLTQNKPLERALIEGVERSRVAKQFLESMLELERAFQERMQLEEDRLKANPLLQHSPSKHAILEEMAQRFYTDLHRRMAEFFATTEPSSSLAS